MFYVLLYNRDFKIERNERYLFFVGKIFLVVNLLVISLYWVLVAKKKGCNLFEYSGRF